MKQFRPQVRTKNFSSDPLRGSLGEFPMRAIVRLGSRTTIADAYPRKPLGRPVIEINTVQAIENSRSKLLMKACFAEAEVPQANWWTYEVIPDVFLTKATYDNHSMLISELPYPVLIKRVFGFKGHGMVKLDNQEQLEEWLSNNNTTGYYFEEYFNGSAEWRLHCTQNECFMAWRKLRRADVEERWFFNSTNCNWVGEQHELFNKPNNWDDMVQAAILAIRAVGLDIGCVDLRSFSPKKENPRFIILETNSGPALSEQGLQAYQQKITELINEKIVNYE